jgi:hypothetical protein
MLGVDLDASRGIKPAHVGWLVGPDGSDGSRRIVWMIKGHPTKSRMACDASEALSGR